MTPHTAALAALTPEVVEAAQRAFCAVRGVPGTLALPCGKYQGRCKKCGDMSVVGRYHGHCAPCAAATPFYDTSPQLPDQVRAALTAATPAIVAAVVRSLAEQSEDGCCLACGADTGTLPDPRIALATVGALRAELDRMTSAYSQAANDEIQSAADALGERQNREAAEAERDTLAAQLAEALAEIERLKAGLSAYANPDDPAGEDDRHAKAVLAGYDPSAMVDAPDAAERRDG